MTDLQESTSNSSKEPPCNRAPRFRHLQRMALVVLLLTLLSSTWAFANPMVHQEGTLIVDGQGKPIKLRGVLLEGWLMWNGTLWGAGFTSESTISKKLQELVGVDEANRFRENIYTNFITEKDIRLISEMGFNVVRVPFNHTILEDDARPYQYKESGWDRLDLLLSWCERHRVYVVLDLHSAPGGQSSIFVNDPDGSDFYNSEDKIKRTVALWKSIASRYRGRKIIAGYDLLNEPQLPWFAPAEKLVDIYVRITRGIREVDTEHMIILSGAGTSSNDLSMFKKVVDSNQAIAFHTYNLFGSDIDRDAHRQYAQIAKELNVPIWNGEIGAHTAEWVEAVIKMFEDPEYKVSGWIFWPWKRVSEAGKRYRNLMEIKPTKKWDAVRNWIAGIWFAPKPGKAEALVGLHEFIEAINADNLVVDRQMKDIITSFSRNQ